jgi:hypothetical protein
MNFLPKAREGIAVVPTAVLCMVVAVHQGLTVDDQLNGFTWPSMQVGQE